MIRERLYREYNRCKLKENKYYYFHRLVGLNIAINCAQGDKSDLDIYNMLVEKHNYFSRLAKKYFIHSLYEEGGNCIRISRGIYYAIKLMADIYKNGEVNYYTVYAQHNCFPFIIPERSF